ncbi:MAG TPA: ThuA domain-containing protein [Verrucomicrobiae bacterium]|jgi:type 1 glutamine amidotransferase|nr:ThuA domain-containing protein [Verrucomicrobiae bacterium]
MRIILFILAAAWTTLSAAADPAFRALVFSETLLYRHPSIPAGIAAVQKLGAENNFAVDASEDPAVFTRTNLARYAVVIFLSTTGNFLDTNQQAAFKDYVEGGGGFVAVHGALAGKEATEGDWPWYVDLLGTTFVTHTPVVPGVIKVEDTNDLSTAKLPARWPHAEEWYFFASNPRPTVHVLATVDESSFLRQPMNLDHPISWRRTAGRGRVWFTALGHTDACFSEPLFLAHLLGGIQYAAAQEQTKLRSP